MEEDTTDEFDAAAEAFAAAGRKITALISPIDNALDRVRTAQAKNILSAAVVRECERVIVNITDSVVKSCFIGPTPDPKYEAETSAFLAIEKKNADDHRAFMEDMRAPGAEDEVSDASTFDPGIHADDTKETEGGVLNAPNVSLNGHLDVPMSARGEAGAKEN